MRNTSSTVALGLLLVAAAEGCGSDGGGGNPACGVAPCGGDVIGAWNIADVCVTPGLLQPPVPADLMEACPQAAVQPVVLDPGGTFVANADMTYSLNISVAVSSALTVPASCLNGVTCAQLNTLVAAQLAANPDPSIQSVTCSGSGDCTCTIVATPQTTTESGTYTTSGMSLITTPAGGAAETAGYCVQGSTLVVRPTPAGTGGMMDSVEAIIAQKSGS